MKDPQAETRTLRGGSSDYVADLARRSEGRFVPGDVFGGRYRIISLLGMGGMGEVYRANDLQLNQTIALKLLPSRSRDALERFRNEVRIARQVTHPNVCRVFDIGESEDIAYLTMEYIDGEDLASLLLRIGRLPEDKGIEIAHQICAGLAAAQANGVLHRDLKPSNIMIDGRGQAHITDFGLAALTDVVEGREARSGTPMYMAPEQLAGERASIRSDIYAVGLILYELFSGRRPYKADSAAELEELRKHTPAPHPSTTTKLDPAIEKAILRCLDPDPSRRPASARALITAFPGMDPLQAALAAGETPSPDAIAGAAESGVIPLRIGIGLLAFALAGLVAIPVVAYRGGWIRTTDLQQSPEVLANHARELAAEFGYQGVAHDAVFGFASRPDGIPQFWYRQAPCPIQADAMKGGLLPPGRVSLDNPPNPCENTANMELDSRGHLVSWNWTAPAITVNTTSVEPSWAKVLSAAGLNSSELSETAATVTPPTAFDRVVAWKAYAASGGEVTVEAAAWRGSPVYFGYLDSARPSTQRPARSDLTPSTRSGQGLAFALAILLIGILGAASLARRNIKSGRIDRRGAFRIAAVIFCLCMWSWICLATHRATFFEVTLTVYAAGWSLAMAALVWVSFVALDPFVRRHWPHAIISLSRVIDGHIRDPLVGRDVLIGICGSVIYALISLQQHSGNRGSEAVAALNGAGALMGELAYFAEIAIWIASLLFCLVFLLRIALRQSWLVAAVLIGALAVVAGLNGASFLSAAAMAAAMLGIQLFLLMRCGLLPFMLQAFIGPTLPILPYTPDLSKWFAAPPLIIIGLTIAASVWAFTLCTQRRDLIPEELLYT